MHVAGDHAIWDHVVTMSCQSAVQQLMLGNRHCHEIRVNYSFTITAKLCSMAKKSRYLVKFPCS